MAKNQIPLLWGSWSLPLAILPPFMLHPPSLFSVLVSERKENFYSTEKSQYCWDFISTVVNTWPVTTPLQGKILHHFLLQYRDSVECLDPNTCHNLLQYWIHQLLFSSQISDLIYKGALTLLCWENNHFPLQKRINFLDV